MKILLIILLLLPSLAISQPAKKILILETMPVNAIIEHKNAFINHMADLGFDTSNITVLEADGSKERVEHLLKSYLRNNKPDLVVTLATLATQVGYELLKGKDIPQLFAVVTDPVGAGVIKKEGVASGEHITGRIYSLYRKPKINILRRILNQKHPDKIIFGALHSSYPSAQGDVVNLKKAAENFDNIEFISYEIPYTSVPEGLPDMLREAEKVIPEFEQKIDYWWLAAGPLYETIEFPRLLIEKSTKPIALGNLEESVKAGALISIRPDFKAGGKELALIADRIFKGEDVGKIPVTIPENFKISINLATALSLGLTIPTDIMLMAETRIYK